MDDYSEEVLQAIAKAHVAVNNLEMLLYKSEDKVIKLEERLDIVEGERDHAWFQMKRMERDK